MCCAFGVCQSLDFRVWRLREGFGIRNNDVYKRIREYTSDIRVDIRTERLGEYTEGLYTMARLLENE